MQKGLQILLIVRKRFIYKSLGDTMNMIRERECDVLKYKIFTGALKRLIKKKNIEGLKEGYKSLK